MRLTALRELKTIGIPNGAHSNFTMANILGLIDIWAFQRSADLGASSFALKRKLG
jgi:hypothetical protein